MKPEVIEAAIGASGTFGNTTLNEWGWDGQTSWILVWDLLVFLGFGSSVLAWQDQILLRHLTLLIFGVIALIVVSKLVSSIYLMRKRRSARFYALELGRIWMWSSAKSTMDIHNTKKRYLNLSSSFFFTLNIIYCRHKLLIFLFLIFGRIQE